MGPVEIVRAVYEEAWSRGEFTGLEGTFADVVRYHSGGVDRDTGLDDLRAVVGRWRTAFPDLQFQIDEIVAADGAVAVRATLRGTHRGEWLGIPPKGNTLEVPHAFFHRFEDGRLVEVWEILDRDLMRRQLEGPSTGP